MTKSAYAAQRSAVRADVYREDGGCCRRCGVPVKLHTDDPFRLANIHEHPSRARGGDPLNPKHTITLCTMCHSRITEQRVTMTINDPALGTRGPVTFTEGD